MNQYLDCTGSQSVSGKHQSLKGKEEEPWGAKWLLALNKQRRLGNGLTCLIVRIIRT